MRFTLLCLALLFGVACKKYDSTLDKVLDTGELVVGTEPEFPPFESKNENGEFVGFDMDMARELAKDLGVKLRIEGMEFTGLPGALDSGRIDLIISGMTATEERAKSRSFSDPYFHTVLCMLVGKDSGINEAADADGKRIVVKLGTTGAIYAANHFKEELVTTLPEEGTCALEVVHGRADAFLYDQHSIIRHAMSNSRTTRAVLDPLSSEPYAMAARHGDTKWVARINEFLKAFREDGRHEALRWEHMPDFPNED